MLDAINPAAPWGWSFGLSQPVSLADDSAACHGFDLATNAKCDEKCAVAPF
jgi:hypothetical protein